VPSVAERTLHNVAVIDQNLTWSVVEDRLTVETDVVLRRNLEQLLVHMKAEAAGDLDALMATVAEDAAYQAFGAPPANSPQGKAAVRKFYEDFISSGATRLQFAIDRLVVDRHCILTEGVMRIAYPGGRLAEYGIEVDDTEAFYLFETHMAVLWPIDEDGLFTGEDSYTGANGFDGIASRKLSAEDIVELSA
jgi:ketosteroid isomerase-like protein